MTRLHFLVFAIWMACGFSARAQEFVDSVDDPSLQAFLDQMEAALREFYSGDPEAYLALLSDSDDLTLLGAAGGFEKGSDAIRDRISFFSRQRSEGTGVSIDYTSIVLGGDLAYTVSVERNTSRRTDDAVATEGALRATNVIRRENGEWKLLHRHADRLVQATGPVGTQTAQ